MSRLKQRCGRHSRSRTRRNTYTACDDTRYLAVSPSEAAARRAAEYAFLAEVAEQVRALRDRCTWETVARRCGVSMTVVVAALEAEPA